MANPNTGSVVTGVSDVTRMLLPETNTVTGPVVPLDPDSTTPNTAAGSSTLGSPGEPGRTTPNSAIPNMQVYGTNGSVLTGSRPVNTLVIPATNSMLGTAAVTPQTTVVAAAPTPVPSVTPVPSASPVPTASPVGQSSVVPTTTGQSANTMGAAPPAPGTLTTSNTGSNAKAAS